MKKALMLVLCILILTVVSACGNSGIIGGADGSTSIIIKNN